jgi:SnoaL-like domain
MGELNVSTPDFRSLEQLLDRQRIERLLYDYTYHLDMNHPQQMADLFVEDCEVNYAPNFGAKGKAAYLKTLEGIGTFFKATSHHVSNICIDFTSDTSANVRAVVYAFHRYTKEMPDSHVWGQYIDEVVKIDGNWFFKRRELRNAADKNYHVKKFNAIGRAP